MPISLDFWVVVGMLGIGIAVDAMIATLSRFHDRSLTVTKWALPLAFTHTVFPFVSYCFFWVIGDALTHGRVIIGLLGFVLIMRVVYEIFMEARGTEPAFSITDGLSTLLNMHHHDARRWIIILSVSWDALLCAPALIPIAEAGDWSIQMTGLAFLGFGIIVGICTTIALSGAWLFRSIRFADVQKLAHINLSGTYLELSAIGGFGLMSLLSTIFIVDDLLFLLLAILSMGIILIGLFHRYWTELKQQAYQEAVLSIEA